MIPFVFRPVPQDMSGLPIRKMEESQLDRVSSSETIFNKIWSFHLAEQVSKMVTCS